jgi:hypothetical protein
MSIKRFGTQLKELLASLDKNEKLTRDEILERFSSAKNGNGVASDVIIANALKTPAFIRKVGKAMRRSDNGRVVLYARKSEPMVMTLERWESLRVTVKNAQNGVRKYWASHRENEK